MKGLLKNKKMMIALAVIVVIVIIFVVTWRKKKAEKAARTVEPGRSDLGTGKAILPVASFPLRPYSMAGEYTAEAGSYGQQIANLQELCNKNFASNLTVDGKLGPKTENALVSNLSPYKMPYTEEVYKGIMLQYYPIPSKAI